MPVVVAAVAVFVEKKVPSTVELVALVTLTVGVIISVFEGKASGNTFGISLSITGGQLFASAFFAVSSRLDSLG
jgi:drug/metabolite transporter (DMT)-like permease